MCSHSRMYCMYDGHVGPQHKHGRFIITTVPLHGCLFLWKLKYAFFLLHLKLSLYRYSTAVTFSNILVRREVVLSLGRSRHRVQTSYDPILSKNFEFSNSVSYRWLLFTGRLGSGINNTWLYECCPIQSNEQSKMLPAQIFCSFLDMQ